MLLKKKKLEQKIDTLFLSLVQLGAGGFLRMVKGNACATLVGRHLMDE